jgi:two-component system, chemotaxis family, chemotaxis protein CheY
MLAASVLSRPARRVISDAPRRTPDGPAEPVEKREVMLPQKILVVDDSQLIHKLFAVIFPKATMVHAHDGHQALQRLAENPDVDILFLDINMPAMNGLELLQRLKADAALAQIPVIIISTEGKEADTVRGLQAGAAAYVRKPFRNEAVVEIARRLLAAKTPGGTTPDLSGGVAGR